MIVFKKNNFAHIRCNIEMFIVKQPRPKQPFFVEEEVTPHARPFCETFLNYGQHLVVNIAHAGTMVSPSFSN